MCGGWRSLTGCEPVGAFPCIARRKNVTDDSFRLLAVVSVSLQERFAGVLNLLVKCIFNEIDAAAGTDRQELCQDELPDREDHFGGDTVTVPIAMVHGEEKGKRKAQGQKSNRLAELERALDRIVVVQGAFHLRCSRQGHKRSKAKPFKDGGKNLNVLIWHTPITNGKMILATTSVSQVTIHDER